MLGVLAFLAFGAWTVFKSVHHHSKRKARWVLPAIEGSQVRWSACTNCKVRSLYKRACREVIPDARRAGCCLPIIEDPQVLQLKVP